MICNAFEITGRIFRGTVSQRNQFPYYVFIENFIEEEVVETCGGSVISNEWILTAAHCVQGALKIAIHFGVHETRNAAEPDRLIWIIKKPKVFIHPGYSSDDIIHDIALINLNKPIKFSQAIQPIKMATSLDLERQIDFETIAIGTGSFDSFEDYDNEVDTTSKYLNWISLKPIPNEQCKEIFPIVMTTDAIFCAENGSGSVVFGDSGGPLIRKEDNQLIGVASFIHSKTSLDGQGSILPQGFTSVAFYRSWIEFVTKLDFD